MKKLKSSRDLDQIAAQGGIRIKTLEELAPEGLRNLFRDAPVSILVGSAISIWEPTNLPSGQQLSNDIFEALFSDPNPNWNRAFKIKIQQWFRELPFERIMERCPNQDVLRRLIKEMFSHGIPNPVHCLLAQALHEGRVDSIVTTNYDCALDRALLSRACCDSWNLMPTVNRVISKPLNEADRRRVYFKIHGSVDDKEGESLVITLRQESALNDWKRKLVRSLWANNILLLVGYSGTDFEICPEIGGLKPKRVFWNFPTVSSITSNAMRVIRETRGVFLIGDMRDLLGIMYEPIKAQYGSQYPVASRFQKSFDGLDLQLWQARILTAMACGGPAVQVCQQLLSDVSASKTNDARLQQELARALYYRGLHRKSAVLFEAAAAMAFHNKDSAATTCDLSLAACDSWRSYGSFRRADTSLESARYVAESEMSNELNAAVNMKELAGLRLQYSLAKLVRGRRWRQVTQSRAEILLRNSADELLRAGAWIKYYETARWAALFDLSLETIKPVDLYEAPPPRIAYARLGDIMGQSIALRDELKKTKHVSDEELSTAEQLAAIAEEFGIFAEAWKMRFLIARKALRISIWKNRIRTLNNMRKAFSSFCRCEYSLPMRFVFPLLEILTSGARR